MEEQIEYKIIEFKAVSESQVALEYVVELTGDTRTDIINRAVQLYAELMKQQDEGNKIKIVFPNGMSQFWSIDQ